MIRISETDKEKSWSSVGRVISPTSAIIFISIVLSALLLYHSHQNGLACWPDSVYYLLSADSLLNEKELSVPITDWHSESDTIAYHHHAPMLPIVLASISFFFRISTENSARILNALCILVMGIFFSRLNKKGWKGVAVAFLFLTSPAYLIWAYGILSETLFLTLIACTLLISSEADSQPQIRSNFIMYDVMIGLLIGLAILTRYAGLFIGPFILIRYSFIANHDWKKRFRSLFASSFSSILLITPWWIHLQQVGTPVREISYDLSNIGTLISRSGLNIESIRKFFNLLSGLVLPTTLPLKFRLAVICFFLSFIVYKKIKLRNIEYLSGWVIAIIYSFGIIVAKLFADNAIPLDLRIFSPALLLLVIDWMNHAEQRQGTSIEILKTKQTYSVLLGIIFGVVITQNLTVVSSATWGVRNNGSGWFKTTWTNSEVISDLKSVSDDTIIFSNTADGIAIACRNRPVKWSCTNKDIDFKQFVERLKKGKGCFAYFPDDWRTDRIMNSEQISILKETFSMKEYNNCILFRINRSNK